jgi:cephalosporin hydroxylase
MDYPARAMIRRVRKSIAWRVMRRVDPWVVKRFHRLFYGSAVWGESRWLGARAYKNPLDLWIFQEIITETSPDLIIETGTHSGGSALYFASVCELLGRGEVLSIDIEAVKEIYPLHPRITYVGGRSSTDPEVVEEVRRRAAGRRTMLILDSDHSQGHVEAELDAYAPLVTEGCYAIVEDSNIGPVRPDLMPGPMQAIETFLASNRDFVADSTRERFMLTFNPSGYLRRRGPARDA